MSLTQPEPAPPPAEGARDKPFLPVSTLPKGGGAIRGIGEKVAVNPARGTCALSVPVFTSPGRSGFGPNLVLGYDSGAGNSPFGLGWSLSVPSVSRKTEKGLPDYTDADTFLLTGADDLVPGTEAVPDETIDGTSFSVTRFRPRVETTFARIERCRSADGAQTFWRSVNADGISSVYGRTAAARIADPQDPRRVFQWLIEEVRDDRGNVARYEYLPESLSGVDPATPWERHRLGLPQAQRYLHRIRYCEHFLVELEYDDAVRPDAFSSYRAGFEVRTRRRCRAIRMLHDFAAEFTDGGPNPRLVRATELSYDDDRAGSHLTAVTQTGYRWNDGYRTESLAPLEFEYTRSRADTVVRVADAGTVENLPVGVDSQAYHWVDLDGDGLPGALTQQGGAWFYKRNLGGGRLGAAAALPVQPAIGGDGSALAVVDVGGDGSRALVRQGPALRGYQERTADGDWAPFTAFRSNPTLAWDDPDLHQVDLTGDGLADLLLARGTEFVWHPSLGRDGYGPPRRTLVGTDPARGPALVRADATESVLLADMSGDGLADLVRIRNGSVCYWPNLGHGRFGAKVTMADAPLFDHPDLFSPERLRVADIDGSGTTDLLYLGATGEVRYWFNRSGNSFGPAQRLPAGPDPDLLERVEVVDLLGTGTACLVWSAAHPSNQDNPLRYVDLSRAVSTWLPAEDPGWAGHKPHLLCQVTNNTGGQTRLVYAPSTRFLLADRAAGRPWATRLPFPVQVVSRVETRDLVAGTTLVSGYRYRHGHYDGPEREFRGFGLVEQTDAEAFPLASQPTATQLHRPPVRTLTWFSTGVPAAVDPDYVTADPPLPASEVPSGLSGRETREAWRCLAAQPLRTEVYADDGDARAGVPYTVTEHRYRVELVQAAAGTGHPVFRQHRLETRTYHYEREPADPRIGHDIVLEVDEYNTVRRQLSIGYPRRVPQIPEQAWLAAVLTVTDVRHETTSWYRLRVPTQTSVYEVSGLPAQAAPYSLSEVRQALAAPATTLRLVDRGRTRYWNDDLTAALPLGQAGRRALVYQHLTAAFTPEAVTGTYGSRVDAAMLGTGCRYQLQDGLWWLPSGVQHYDPGAFYLPTLLADPWANESSVEYDAYHLLPTASYASQTAPFNRLVTRVENDYRVLAARQVTEPNGNRTAVAFDALGRVTAAWAKGKEGSADGDPDALPGAEFSYGARSWYLGQGPVWALTRTRERHGAADGPWQQGKAYSDGSGRVVMTKKQAEPGLAWMLVNGVLTQVDTGTEVRWVGTGRTVFDNKGKPVKKYEPYFSVTDGYEDEPDLVQQGVTPVLHYDPVDRLVRTDHPDGTFTRAVIGAWSQQAWDANDTVLDSLWYAERGSPDPTNPAGENDADPQRRAAWLAAQHAGTPEVSYLDSLGRTVRTVADGGPLGRFETRTVLDIEGNTREVVDPRGVSVLRQDLDLAGRVLHTHSPDAGDRWVLPDVSGTPVRSWDSGEGLPGNTVETEFDTLHRPVRTWVTPPVGGRRLVEAIWYGEAHPAALADNLLGRPVLTLDGAGLAQSVRHDFKGNLLVGRRRLAATYQQEPDWAALAGLAVADVENTANQAGLLDPDVYPVRTEFDALNRPSRNVLPDGSITTPGYNEAGLLETVEVNHIGPVPVQSYVRELDYDAKGQRTLVVYGNFLRTRYTYDPLTYRLVRLESFRSGSPARLQDLRYTYDPVGNVTEVRDDAQQTQFYAGQVTVASTRYTYDALYRLASATGREHDSLGSQPDSAEPVLGKPIPHPNDAAKVRPYTQRYSYDEAGNLTRVRHIANGGSWTRDYEYAATSNRLVSHTRTSAPTPVYFGHDERGNMTAMPHLPGPLVWDHANRLSRVEMLGGGTAYYRYDFANQRLRKVLHRNGATVEERVYLGGFEVHRRSVNGAEVFRRTTVHVQDDTRPVALIEHKTVDGGPAAEVRVRYQLGNHLGSCSLEVDDSVQALVISYEEYHPYGTTSLWLGAGDIEVSDRRYRYTGKEKDAETGLYYHGARYYAPWLGRWTAADPAGFADGTNRYQYVRGNPVKLVDPNGMAGMRLVVGDSTGSPAGDADLMEAGYAMVVRMKDELRDLFGIETVMGHQTKSYSSGFGCGCVGVGAPTSITGYKEITLRISGDQNAQRAAQDKLRARLSDIEKKAGGGDAAIKARVDKRMADLEKARNFLIDRFNAGFDLKAQTSVTVKSKTKTLIGMAAVGTQNNASGDMYVNPYTFFREDSGKWVEGIEAGSARARAAVGPAMQLLHELVHFSEKLIGGGSTPAQFDISAPDEAIVIADVDKAVKSIEELVAQREWYGVDYHVIDAHGREFAVKQNQPGDTYVLGSEGRKFNIDYTGLTGREWIKWPSQNQLTTGRK